jgi:GT2 family glycosyltransferase
MELSVVIVSYNVRIFLEQCLYAVRKASAGIECEVFVVDNNSADGSCSMVSNAFPEVSLIINQENRGFAAASNQALKLSTGKYLLLLNPDTLIGEDAFVKCISFIESHPDAGAVGVKMINGKGKFLPESKRGLPSPGTAFFKITGLSCLFPRSGVFNRYYLGNIDCECTSPADVISGAFMFIRREVFLSTGMLDEDYFLYGEDVDYSYRLLKSGFRNYYYPDVRIIHYKGESTGNDNFKALGNFYKAMLTFVKKHYANGSYRSFVFLINAAIYLTAGISAIKKLFKRVFLPVNAYNQFPVRRRTIVVSDPEGYSKVEALLFRSSSRNVLVGRVSAGSNDMKEDALGNLGQLREIIRAHAIKEVIFTSGNSRASQIIDSMHLISDMHVRFKIISANERIIPGLI